MSGRDRKVARPNAKGRNDKAVGKSGWRLQVMRSFWLSPVASAMTVNEKALFWELTSLHTGGNNGELFMSVRDATHRIGLNDYAAGINAFNGLIGLGLITVTADACFNVKASEASRARAFRLNWIDDNGQPKPGDAFPLDAGAISPDRRRRVERRMKALKAFVRDREQGKFAVGESLTIAARMDAARERLARESLTLKPDNHANLPNEAIRESLTYLDYHGVRGRMPSDIMVCMRTCDPAEVPFVIGSVEQQTPFCRLIAMRRSINMSLKKSDPHEFCCEECRGPLTGGRAERRFCDETCRKRAEGKRRYERQKVAA